MKFTLEPQMIQIHVNKFKTFGSYFSLICFIAAWGRWEPLLSSSTSAFFLYHTILFSIILSDYMPVFRFSECNIFHVNYFDMHICVVHFLTLLYYFWSHFIDNRLLLLLYSFFFNLKRFHACGIKIKIEQYRICHAKLNNIFICDYYFIPGSFSHSLDWYIFVSSDILSLKSHESSLKLALKSHFQAKF